MKLCGRVVHPVNISCFLRARLQIRTNPQAVSNPLSLLEKASAGRLSIDRYYSGSTNRPFPNVKGT